MKNLWLVNWGQVTLKLEVQSPMWCCQNTQVGEGHVNANYVLIVQALHGLRHSSSNCKPLWAGLSVLVSINLTENGARHKCHVACCGSVVAVTWNIVPFFPCYIPCFALIAGAQWKYREQNSCGTLRLGCGSSSQAPVWNGTLLIQWSSVWNWMTGLRSCGQIFWGAVDPNGQILFVYPLVCVLMPLHIVWWVCLVLRVVSRR